ncbi:hypothetical protein CBS147311_4630 [Penicillium roqueforti]|nr:hypothetical protein CBS147311_4630 [Penicillium roqueforti]
MIHKDLPPSFESIRRIMKELMPETATSPNKLAENQAAIFHENKNGNKAYRGDLLAKQISLLTIQLRVTEKLQIGTDWRWHLVHFSKDTKLENVRKEGYLIVLSNTITITPGGVLKEGSYIYIINEPVISAGATAIFIVPPPLD